MPGRIPRIWSTPQTREVVKETLDTAEPDDHRAVTRMFEGMATSDGNRHLSYAEAMTVRDAWTASGHDVSVARPDVLADIEARAAARDPDGIKTYFTSTDKNVGDRLVAGFEEIIGRAAGKPVEFNAMVFAFTAVDIANSILDLAEAHPNVTFRLIADFSQLTLSGNRQPSRIVNEARERGLDNIDVRFKRDGGYVWSASKGRPVYHHGSTKGLNHHKGYVALIDGKPVKLFTGSFNWSQTAEKKNYENLFVVDSSNAANRDTITRYQAEFAAFFNHDDALTQQQARAFKRKTFNDLRVANGKPALASIDAGPAPAPYVPRAPSVSFDVNQLSDKNYARLQKLVKDRRVIRSIVYSLATYGPFSDFDALLERVGSVARLPAERIDAMRSAFDFGDGQVPINTASVGELVRGLKIPRKLALAIVARRKSVGDFEGVADLRDVPGMTSSVLRRLTPRINDDVGRAYFSSRGYHDAAAGTGYAPVNATGTTPVMGVDGTVTDMKATLSAGVIDLIRRAKPGDTAKIAMYGMSASTKEYAEIVDAAARGVKFDVILNKAYNGAVAASLKALSQSGLPIRVRVQRGRTMHEKFGVVNDDVFQGSANFSSSSSSKHSEDRFVVKNNAQLASEFSDEFTRIWNKSHDA